jgi:hypothetical protein
MALDRRTIAELEKDGFTHIDACCASCGRIRADAVQVVADARADHQGNEDRRAAPPLPMPELREFTRGAFRPVATRRQHGLTNAVPVEGVDQVAETEGSGRDKDRGRDVLTTAH